MAGDLDLSQFQLLSDALGGEFARRINVAKGPLRVLVPLEGFSEHTKRRAQDIDGNDRAMWKRPEDYRIFADSLKKQVKTARIDELMLHVNDIQFADACVDTFVEIAKRCCDNSQRSHDDQTQPPRYSRHSP